MKYYLCIFLLLINIHFACSQENILFKSEDKSLRIATQVRVLEDPSGVLTLQDILKEENQRKFQASEKASVNLLSKNSAHWLQLTLSNHTNQDTWLAIDKSFILLLDFYAPDKNGNYNNIIHTGALRSFESRAYPIISGFWLPLNKAQDSQNKTYYIRIESHFIYDVIYQLDNVLQVATLPVLHQQKINFDNLSAAFLGLMLMMILYNSFLYYLSKDIIYFFYTGYIIFTSLAATFLNSYPIVEYLTGYQIQSFLNNYFSIWTYPILIFSGLFCIKYLDLKTNLPLVKRIIEGIMLSQIITILLNLTGVISMFTIVILEQLVPICLYITCISAAFYLFFFKSLKQARYYLLGWSFFLIGVTLLLLSVNKFIPYNFYIRNATYFGIALEVWMFSLALGERVRFLQKERIQADNLVLIEKEKNLLEEKARERTKQLEAQNLKLQANKDVLQKTLGENKKFIRKIELQKEELQANNLQFQINQEVLKKNKDQLTRTLVENEHYLEKIQQQKEELKINNRQLISKEEELRQNFEELQSTQDILEKKQRQLQVTLAENQSITHALNKSAIISITDLRGDILHVNDIFCEISGYTKDELIDQNQNIVNSGYHPKEMWKEMWKTIGKGKTWRGEIKNRAKDGSYYWVDAVINPMYNDHGQIYSYLSIRYLITDKKEAEEKIKEQTEAILRKNKKISKTIETISSLAQNPKLLKGDWEAVSREAIQAGIKALDIDTCQLWYYNFKEVQMYCVAHDSVVQDTYPQTISPKESPLFFKVLEKEHLFIVNDIENERTIDEADKVYFLNQGYKALIVFPVILSKTQTGVLVCLHQEVHAWENEDIVFLKSLNDEFAFAYQAYRREKVKEKVREQNDKIISINRNIQDSINYAERIQKAILTNLEKIKEHLPNSFIFFKPRDIVSGDFYFFTQRNYKLVIAAVDCTGHGIPGAFMSLIGHNLLSEIVNIQAVTQPDKILTLLREGIINVLQQEETQNHDGMDIAICTIDQYPEELYEEIGIPHLEYAGAGNPLIYFQENELIQLKSDKIIIGGFNNYLKSETFSLHRIPLDKVTTFYIFSDGIQDQFGGEHGKKFATRRLRALLQEIHQQDMEEQSQIVSETIENWQTQGNQSQIDDMLLIGVRV